MNKVKIIFISIIISLNLNAQEIKEFDLQENIEYESKIVSTQKVITVKLKNLSSDWSYSIDIDQTRELIPVLIVPTKILVTETFYDKEVFKDALKSGDKVTIIVIGKKTGSKDKKWEFVLKTIPRGQWVTTVGFNHVLYYLKGNKSYHTSLIDTNSNYQIIKDGKKNKTENWLDVKPSITFRWFPNEKAFKCLRKCPWMDNWDFSLVGGFGTDLKETNVLLGFGISYNQNLSIDFGLTTNQVYVLKGEYSSGQIVKTPLTYEELHKKILVVNPFVNIAFRLDKNPFSN